MASAKSEVETPQVAALESHMRNDQTSSMVYSRS